MKPLAALLTVVVLAGCDQAKTEQKPDSPKQPSPHYQRFVPIQPSHVNGVPWHGALALDTKTGQLCTTYPLVNNKDWDALPTCEQLFIGYPD
jgi:hypothetical protein